MATTADSTVQPLLDPVRLGALDLPNRIVMAPLTRARAQNPDLAPTGLHALYYAQRASAGLIVSEGTWVNEQSIGAVNVPGIYSEAQTAAWAEVTAAVHERGGRILSQLGHVGSLSHPDHFGGALPVAPSAVNPGERSFTPTGMKDTLTPRAFTAAEIARTIADYRSAAENARVAGFDGIEIHAQGPQLIGQFLNPRLNLRTDSYGGGAERRARFLLDILDAVTGVWDTRRVAVKLSPYWTSGHAFTADEETLADYDRLVGRLSAGGLAFLHLMGPVPGTASGTAAGPVGREEPLAPFARYRKQYEGPLVANVGFTRERANDIIASGVADAVSFGAPFIANPDLVERFTHGHPLAESDPATVYSGQAGGYTDYPAVSETG